MFMHILSRMRLCNVCVVQVPMLVVFGKPIELPKIKEPSKDEVQKYLQVYINAMKGLCEKHKQDAGYGDTMFSVV